ncbi:formin-like protein 18 [Tanacetum coccineum]
MTDDDELDVPHDFSSDSDSDSKDPDNQRVMALVQGRGHGGDNGPPNDDVPWQPPSGCKRRWKDRKSNFKKHEFVLRDDYKEPIKIRNFPSTDIKIEEWRKLCDHFTSEKHLKRSRSSKVNRSKQLYSSNQGTKSYAQSRYEEFNEETGEFPDLIDHFRAKHMRRGKWNHSVNKMIELREAQEGQDTLLTVDQIMSQVLGESRGFLPDRGRRLPNSAFASSSCSAQSDPPAPPMMFPSLPCSTQISLWMLFGIPPEDDAALGDDVAFVDDVAFGNE